MVQATVLHREDVGGMVMTHKEKIEWMAMWAVQNRVTLDLNGECGFGRECVGILADGTYPDYEWDDENYERKDKNGDVWVPENAYHKHPCVAVLGRGEKAEVQLYDWLKWFDDNGFKVEVSQAEKAPTNPIELMMGRSTDKRMVKDAR